MKTFPKTIALLSGAALFASSAFAESVTTGVVGYTSTTLPAGAGNIFAPSFVNADSFVGTATAVTPGASSTITVSSALVAGAFNETVDDAGVSKGYPQYYVEILNDTNAGSVDTEGLVLDIVSNTATGVVVAADTSALEIQGDEQIAIRKHITLKSLFAGSTGLVAYSQGITIYNEDGPGSVVTHLPNATAEGFVLAADFTTISDDAPIYPGTGFVINNSTPVTIVPVGNVKETDTQVVIYGNSVVNIVSALQPLSSVDLGSDGRLNGAVANFSGVATQYTSDGALAVETSVLDSAGSFVDSSDFTTPTDLIIDGTSEAVVVNASVGTVYKAAGNVIQ